MIRATAIPYPAIKMKRLNQTDIAHQLKAMSKQRFPKLFLQRLD